MSLQYGEHGDEIRAARERFGVSIFEDPEVDPLTDMDGFAAQVAAMDAVITIDNSALAVAAGLGIPTIAMLARSADWRYTGSEHGCPWHDCLQLFRQGPEGEWEPVIDAAAAALRNMIKPVG